MTLQFSLALDSVLLRRRPGWRPAALFSGGATGAWYSPDRGIFQDTAGAVPVTAPGQTVGLMCDLSGNGRHATQAIVASRPVFGRHPASGIRNLLPNNGTEGAVPGVVGNGGIAPTGWSILHAGGSAGVSAITAITDEYIDVEVTQTGTSGSVLFVFNSTSLAAVKDDERAFSLGLALLGGSVAGSIQLRASIRDGADMAVTSEAFGANLSLTETVQQFDRAHTITTASAVQARYDLRINNSAAWTATFRISRPQVEAGLTNSALQKTRAAGFDITEAGQRSVCYLRADGVDDWMALSSTFEPTGAHTLAAVRGFDDLGALTADRGVTFGRSDGQGAFLARSSGDNMQFRINTTGNAMNSAGGFSGHGTAHTTVEIAMAVDASTGQMWRNGVAPAGGLSVTGALVPLLGINAIGRRSGGYASGRFYGGALIDRAITKPERQLLQHYLAAKGGITL